MRFNLDNYETVESRLARFWEQYPNGQVFTQIHHYDDNKVVFRAEIYKDINDPRPVATGYAEELRDASPVNRTFGGPEGAVETIAGGEGVDEGRRGGHCGNLGPAT